METVSSKICTPLIIAINQPSHIQDTVYEELVWPVYENGLELVFRDLMDQMLRANRRSVRHSIMLRLNRAMRVVNEHL